MDEDIFASITDRHSLYGVHLPTLHIRSIYVTVQSKNPFVKTVISLIFLDSM